MLYRFSLSSSCFNALSTSSRYQCFIFCNILRNAEWYIYVIVASRIGEFMIFQYFDSNPPPSDARLGISYLQLARYQRFYFDDPIKEARILLSPSPVLSSVKRKYTKNIAL
jgi:hypothetical protein